MIKTIMSEDDEVVAENDDKTVLNEDVQQNDTGLNIAM